MSRSDADRVADILDAAEQPAEIAREGRSEFDENWKTRLAAERLIEIIGEAAGAISPELARAHPELPLREAKGMRVCAPAGGCRRCARGTTGGAAVARRARALAPAAGQRRETAQTRQRPEWRAARGRPGRPASAAPPPDATGLPSGPDVSGAP